MISKYGRRFGLPEAAAFLDVTVHTLRRLVRDGRITYHREPAAPGRPATRGLYFFYETELEAYIEATRVAPTSLSRVPAVMDPQLRALMPETRRFA